jgi:hypothetical protein
MNYSRSSSTSAVHFNSMPAPPLQALLARSIDYAGLFPPAELALEPALTNHARYVRSDDSWMLGTFVLPTGKFAAATVYFSQFDAEHPLRISALGAKTDNASDFREKLSAATAAIHQLQADNPPGVSVVQLEIPLPSDCDLHLLGALHAATNDLGLRIFCETPPAQADRTIALLAQNNTSRHSPLGYKLRSGGITADAFPTSEQIARALVVASRDHVPIKFTAGLHHPVRHFRREVNGKMHGFLNVLGAGVLGTEYGWDEPTTTKMLEDEEPKSFIFDQENFSWREWKIGADAIQIHRELVTSFGSCSFDEPREDLRELGLMQGRD